QCEAPTVSDYPFCDCRNYVGLQRESTHFLSDWIIREKGMRTLKNWGRTEQAGSLAHLNEEDSQRWCPEGRLLQAEDLRKFFLKNLGRLQKEPRGDCFIYCSDFEPGKGRSFSHVYYGSRDHCTAGVGSGSYLGAAYYEYYVDKDQHFSQVYDTFDKAANALLAALRSSIVLKE
ncbi:hypothetical protein AAVH_39471, partial [Aphelenchoides avenae]